MLINVEEIFSRNHRGNDHDQLMVGGKLWTLFHFAVGRSSQDQEIFSVIECHAYVQVGQLLAAN